MATDTLMAVRGTQAWDVGANWSLGHVPAAADDAVVAGPAFSTVTIAASDPAYTVGSLATSQTVSVSTGQASLTVAGRLTVTGAASLNGSDLSLTGSASVSLGSLAMASGTVELGFNASPTLAVGALTNLTTAFGGTIQVASGAATIGSVMGTFSFNLDGGTLAIGSSGGGDTYTLQGGLLTLMSAATTENDTLVAASTGGSSVDLSSIAYQPGETAVATLKGYSTYSIALRSSLGQPVYTFQNITSSFPRAFGAQPAPAVYIADDGAGGTLVTFSPACYAASTMVAVIGGECRVSDLAIGDLIVTAAGVARPIKWIGRRSYAGRFLQANPDVLPVRFMAGSLGCGLPARDLLVSPEHAMLIDGMLIPARCLINDVTVRQEMAAERVDYVHVELESHDTLLAEGVPSETFVDDNSRMRFQNAHEFAALYPGAARVPASYCAPRIDHGEAVAAVRRRIDQRAGLAIPGCDASLAGRVDELDGRVLSGWAQNPDAPEAAVVLEVFVGGAAVARTLANVFRPDLLAAGLGSGCHSFRVRLPRTAGHAGIEVRRVSDGATLGRPAKANPAVAGWADREVRRRR